MNRPFFRKQNQTWYCYVNGKQKRLAKDKDEAFRLWHDLSAGRREIGQDRPLADLVSDFLQWTKNNKAPSTHRWYLDFLTSFCQHAGNVTIRSIRAFHIEAWIEDEYPDASATTRNGLIRCVSRLFNWAKKRQVIPDLNNPVLGIERPQAEARQTYVEADQWRTLMKHVDGSLKDLMTVLRETGCRPEEARRIESRHVDRANNVWVIPAKEAKGRKHDRIIALTAKAKAVTERLMLKYPEGPLFRNSRGGPWTSSALTHAFRKVATDTDIEITPYAIRHTYITDALVNGVDPITLAELVGHRTLDMIQRTYQKLRYRRDHIQESAKRAVGGA
jgi:integrase